MTPLATITAVAEAIKETMRFLSTAEGQLLLKSSRENLTEFDKRVDGVVRFFSDVLKVTVTVTK